MSIQKRVQDKFGAAAARYTSSAVHAKGEDLGVLVKAAQLDATMRVLDAGCGAGHAAFAVAPQVAEVIAYDLTPAMLAQVAHNAAERGLENIKIQEGDVQQLPYDSHSFDRIVTRYSSHHWPDVPTALREAARVLKPDGLFVVSDAVAPPAAAADTFLQALELLRDPSHVRDYSVAQWQAMLAEAGFTSSVVLDFEVRLHFAKWLARIGTPPVLAAALRTLFADAPAPIKAHFQLPDTLPDSDDFEFIINGAVIAGQL